ncbi:sulfatase-like hydrolase/transferase [Shimia thalassica]|uniref:sulfatase-like hydrolase/transferase n=1 Tax=Shimia thalassica TaxID=1715693 RepID=UPI0026E48C5F|nr:sulfatase-like hydrolase/transferase [Shimia thalassica]MDO6522895.1 sulfatase-like hydrolase/transferase [Shimia thalassica]
MQPLHLRKGLWSACAAIALIGQPLVAGDIIHDADFYVLKAQHGEDWAAMDGEIDAKLAALREKFGTPPNIIHIMWDDTPVGDVGIPALQLLRGLKTPHMNQLAAEGANFMRMYTEPSCTQSRAAVITGRHPIRNGLTEVGFPYEYGGLSASEVTMAEVLGPAGYNTAFYGKSHMGDIEESYMNRQGFDEAVWSSYNQFPVIYGLGAEIAGGVSPTTTNPEIYPDDPYDMDPGWRTTDHPAILAGTKDGPVRELVTSGDLEGWYREMEANKDRHLAFIDKSVEDGKPFYIAHWPQLIAFVPYPERKTLSGGFLQEGLARFDPFVGQLMDHLEAKGIAENTLVILMADNGPMVHNGPPGMVETLHRGGKGDYLEGGIRVPAMAWWPGMIEPGQTIGDIIHETDLFTTFARLGGAMDHVPTDRVIDGVDQTALFVEGDSHSRRDWVHVYTGDVYAASVKGRFKRHWAGNQPGLSKASYFDLYNDPREVQPKMLPMFPTKGMFDVMKARHEIWMEQFPNNEEAFGFPFTGIENARPKTLEHTKPRFSPDEVPFDAEAALRRAHKNSEYMEQYWGLE